jgi:predicted RNase H-like HicB family nuclease/predicted RNA binding protein YcfA (HicA-like mRNA interferase family)
MKVREILERLQKEGWILARPKGTHRQFVHSMKPGMRVTASGNTGLDMPTGTLNVFVNKQVGSKIDMRYAIIIEKSVTGYGAFVPDLPGCVAVGESVEETERLIRKAIEFHLDGMKEDGVEIPLPTSVAEYVEV